LPLETFPRSFVLYKQRDHANARVREDGTLPVGDIEELWAGFAAGDSKSRDELLSLHYDEMRRVARRVLNTDSAKLQMQPTDLANEAAIRLLKLDRIDWQSRTHFLALSARVMRQVLLDEVRRLKASKRQAPPILSGFVQDGHDAAHVLDLEAFDAALTRLFDVDAELARVVELRFYVGMTIEEVAFSEQISESTVKRQWRAARAWLLKELMKAD
jgi:RNA polymerase sigma factor (TIGR02999 family)